MFQTNSFRLTFSLWIIKENIQTIDKIGSIERITANADAQRLAKADFGCLVNSFVGERARTRHNANLALGVNVSGHDADLALARLDDAWAVGTDQTRLGLTHQTMLDLDHVQLRYSLGDAHNQRHLGVECLVYSCRRSTRWHVDDRGIGSRLISSLGNIMTLQV